MSAANEYGVDETTLQAFVADLTISASSSPNSTQVATIIQTEAASLRGYYDKAFGDGEADALEATDSAYDVLAGILLYRAVAAILRARNRGIDAEGYAKEAGIALTRLIKAPQSIKQGAGSSTSAEGSKAWRDRTGNGATTGTWAASVAGKIASGGSL